MSKHRTFLDQLVEDHGFPTKKMIGGDYAMSAVKLIIMQATSDYKLKYKAPFVLNLDSDCVIFLLKTTKISEKWALYRHYIKKS